MALLSKGSRRAFCLVLAGLVLAACGSAPENPGPEPEAQPEKTDPPRVMIAKNDPGTDTNFGRETDIHQLFVQLDRQLRNTRDPETNALAAQKMRPILTRYVNTNFGLIRRAILSGKNDSHRLVAAWSLGYATDPGAVSLLLELLKDPSPKVRTNALHALATLRDPATPMRPIVAQFSDPEVGVRVNAARAIREILQPGTGVELIVPLTGLLADEDARVRLAAVGALGKIGRPECIGFLVNALMDKKPLIRGQAALALGKTEDPEAVDHLIGALQNERNPLCLSGILKALQALTGQTFTTRAEWEVWWKENRG